MDIQVELVGALALIIGVIAGFLRIQINADNYEKRLDALSLKQQEDHDKLLQLQADKEKALWDEMRNFRSALLDIRHGLGRVEGKLDYIKGS